MTSSPFAFWCIIHMNSDTPLSTKAEASAALSWWLESGVDVLVADAPFDWLGLSENPPEQSLPPVAPAPKAADLGAALNATPEMAQAARALVQNCTTLEALSAALHQFRPATLDGPCLFPTQLVEGRPLILLGAPDEAEERAALPLVGPAGHLFDRMLAAIGLSRGQVNIVHLCCWRPPADRALSADEEAMCLVFARALANLARPPAILAMGQLPARTLLEEKSLGINRLRGKWRDIFLESGPRPLLATFTPDSLLRRPGDKKLAWLDLQAYRALLDQTPAA